MNRSTNTEGAILEAILYSGPKEADGTHHGIKHTKFHLSQLLDVAKRNGLEGVSLYSTRDKVGFSKLITDVLHLELFEYRKRKYVVWDDAQIARVCNSYGVPFSVTKIKLSDIEFEPLELSEQPSPSRKSNVSH